jgi:PqqA peptide cyclase
MIEPPLALLAEVTHRCPLACPYCSNPLALAPARRELAAEHWLRVLREAAALGVLQAHFSGGEPLVRSDLEAMVEAAARAGLYGNLITSGLGLTAERARRLAGAGLEHVQLSFQGTEAAAADAVAGRPGAHRRKLAAAQAAKAAGLALTLNLVLHRRNLGCIDDAVELALALGAERLELAHVQYHGWAERNREALLPTAAAAPPRRRTQGRLVIDYVPCDMHASRPKPCMGGWGRRFLIVAPDGRVLPCHAAATIPGLRFESVLDAPLAAIWERSPAFERFRGTAWLPDRCRSCDRLELDFGGCRCQALALAGDAAATDPVCALSPLHASLPKPAEGAPAAFVHRARAPA